MLAGFELLVGDFRVVFQILSDREQFLRDPIDFTADFTFDVIHIRFVSPFNSHILAATKASKGQVNNALKAQGSKLNAQSAVPKPGLKRFIRFLRTSLKRSCWI